MAERGEASTLAMGLPVAFVASYCAITLGLIAEKHPDSAHILLGAGVLLALVASLIRRSEANADVFMAQVVLTYLPFGFFAASWLPVPGLLAGASLLLPTMWRWVAFVAVVIAESVLAIGIRADVGRALLDVAITALVGVVFYGVARLAAVIRAAPAAQAQLVQREQMRVYRDLHDLFGNRLAVIALKSELAQRLIDTDSPRAQAQLRDVLDIAREAQGDVRALARGSLQTSVTAELASARSALEAAGAEVQVDISCLPIPYRIDSVLVAVVREGVTNVLRHSAAGVCRIDLLERDGWIRLRMLNDGAAGDAQSGSGIANLGQRMVAIGGRLTAGLRADGRYELIAEVAYRRES